MLKNNQHRALHRAVVATTMLIFLVGFGCTTAEPVREPVVVPSQEPDTRFEGSYPAPPFPAGAVWLNTNVPPTVDRVAGRLVIIDFWTSGCINCIHMIPVLKQLQAEFREEIAVIGVHSGKFVTEGRTDSIRATLNRYGIDHPVMNDADFRAWRRFQIGAWPTLVFVDPRGRVIGTQAGEVPAPTLRAFVDELITYWDLQYPGELDRSPLPWEGTPGIGERAGSAAGQLFKFPQGVALDAGGTTLYVSDTANHRILAIDTESFHIEAVIGGSGPGFADGDFGTSRFHRPRGLDTRGDMLYVADSGNFAIRRIDLAEGVVDTIAGTGAQGRGAPPPGTEFPTTAPFELSTPWDVAPGPDGTVHVSMTGVHQIWSWELSADTFGPIAGTGHEGAVSGVSLATAELAQPTGIALADGRLFVADAESSTIREIDFGSDTVARLAGTPERSLFDFGNADGPPGVNRFQHPRGIAVDSEAVYVADTYNHAIRRIDRHTGEVTTVAGGETGGYRDGPIGIASFSEPGALALDGPTLYVADTNNHAVRKINLTAGTVSTVPVLSSDVVTDDRERTEPDRREPRRLAPDADRLVLELQFPEGVGLNGEIPSEYDVTGSMGLDFDQATGAITDSTVEVAMDLRAENTGAPFVRLAATVYFCEKENPTLCFVDHLSIEVPLRVDVHRGDRSVVIEHPVTIPAAFTGLSGDG